jgi:hypothetical protein
MRLGSGRAHVGVAHGVLASNAPARDLVREIARLACDRRSVRDLRGAGHAIGIGAQLTVLVPPLTVPMLEPRHPFRI